MQHTIDLIPNGHTIGEGKGLIGATVTGVGDTTAKRDQMEAIARSIVDIMQVADFAVVCRSYLATL